MNYKSKIEKAKQLRDSVEAFLKELTSQDEHLEIASKHVNTAINYFGANVATVFFRAYSIRIKVSGKTMLQMYYSQLQSESIPCRYENDDSHTTHSRTFISVDALYAQKALQSIILTVQNSRSGRQDINAASRPIPAEVESAMVRQKAPESELPQMPDVTLSSKAAPVSAAPQKPVAESLLVTHEPEIPTVSFDLQEEKVEPNDMTPLEVHSVLTGKVIKMLARIFV